MLTGSRFFAVLSTIGMLAASSAFAAGSEAGTVTLTNNKPKFTATAKNLGGVDPKSIVEVTIWLNPHNKSEMDALAKDLYDPKSANYRHWVTKAEFAKKFAPTAAEAKKVGDFFTGNNMKVVKMGPDNFYVRASGTAAAVSSAFHVSLNNYEVNGKIVRGNPEDPSIKGEAAPLVAAVAGLESTEYTHPYATRLTNRNPPKSTGGNSSVGAVSAATGAVTSVSLNPVCITGQTKQSFTSSGTLPEATYSGNEYTSNNAGCGYTPETIWATYNLKGLYAEGFNGKGQTIVILDWCGSPTIQSDANAFSSRFNLPQLTAANFQIIHTTGPSYCAATDPEINIDVEWAHAIAPGAAIDLVVPPSASFQDVDEGMFYAVDYQLGNVFSGSYGSEEIYTSTSVLLTEELITETAAILGISTNFSTGDDGDFTFDFPEFYTASVSAPADSPYATGVGGVSLGLNPDGTIQFQSGWGTNENLLSEEGYVPDPPAGDGYFNFGSGGGASAIFAKPAYQKGLKGPARLLPDISWLADPFTGAVIAISEPFSYPELTYQVYGGTSLACPMFSALWAIANQEAGASLGQAAPYLYTMPASTITDILPVTFGTNVTGVVEDSAGKKSYTAAQLASPLEGSTKYISAVWDYPLEQDTAILLTFGTDSGLATTKGWDDVTGVGVPNGKAFADYFKP
jgi:subtilase family serine protease